MKKSILSLLLIFAAGITSSVVAQEIIQGAAIEFNEDVHDYGDVEYSANGTCTFVFTNTGTEPLIISNAKGSCGCTVPTWPKEPIAPGASANLDVTYDTKRVGSIAKSVTITSNAVNEPVKVIRISGNVLAAPVDEEPEMVLYEEEVEVEVPVLDLVPVVEDVPMTKAEIKAATKAEKAAEKAGKKATKLAEKEAKKAAKLAAKA